MQGGAAHLLVLLLVAGHQLRLQHLHLDRHLHVVPPACEGQAEAERASGGGARRCKPKATPKLSGTGAPAVNEPRAQPCGAQLRYMVVHGLRVPAALSAPLWMHVCMQ